MICSKKIFLVLFCTLFFWTNSYSTEQISSELSQTTTNNTENTPIEKKLIPLDIKETKSPLVDKFHDQYLSPYGKKWLESVMTSSVSYRGYVQKTLKEHNMPLCLQYLPVIESSYKISALSKSGAYGLWQFMKNSVSPFNMTINSWLDERKDPWISTDAAIKKLQENYNYLGNWELALAAYNSGLGAINRIVTKTGSKNFWYLAKNGYLKEETKNYVPKFLAIASILTNKEYYDLTFPEPDSTDKSINFEEIIVQTSIDLSLLAKETNISLDDLSFYNPSLFYSVTPPSSKYKLRIPRGEKANVQQVLSNSSIPLLHYTIYSVKSGDSLYALSQHYGLTVDEIKKVNSLHSSVIKIGQKLMIPAIKKVGDFKNNKFAEKAVFNGTYKVTQKDTLWSISLKYNVQVEELASENNMQINDVLRIGTVIKVPIIQ